MASDKAPMLAVSRVPDKIGLLRCCAPGAFKRKLTGRNRATEKAAWRREAARGDA